MFRPVDPPLLFTGMTDAEVARFLEVPYRFSGRLEGRDEDDNPLAVFIPAHRLMARRGGVLLGLGLLSAVGTVYLGGFALIEAHSRDVPGWAVPLLYVSFYTTAILVVAGIVLLAWAAWFAIRTR